MRRIALAWVCLTCICHGRRAQHIPTHDLHIRAPARGSKPREITGIVANVHADAKADQTDERAISGSTIGALKFFAAHLLALDLAFAYKPSAPGARPFVGNSSSSHPLAGVSHSWDHNVSHVPVMWREVFDADAIRKVADEQVHEAEQAKASAIALMLSFVPAAVVASAATTNPEAISSTDLNVVAQILGYLVGAGSLLLYTPIIWRVVRQDNADGLALSTWWLKLSAYTATDIYCVSRGFPLSSFVETAIISVEAAVLLILIAWQQDRLFGRQFIVILATYLSVVGWAVLAPASSDILALGQASSAILTTAALVPQLTLNWKRRDPGDYSPLTAGLSCLGCSIRLFTTSQLAGGDPILLGSFGLALILNSGLLAQILYFGLAVQQMSLLELLGADFVSAKQSTKDDSSSASGAGTGL